MQKNKKATIIVILIILIYGLIAEFKLLTTIYKVYLYLLNPVIWIGIALFLKYSIGKTFEIKKFKKDIISYSFIAVNYSQA